MFDFEGSLNFLKIKLSLRLFIDGICENEQLTLILTGILWSLKLSLYFRKPILCNNLNILFKEVTWSKRDFISNKNNSIMFVFVYICYITLCCKGVTRRRDQFHLVDLFFAGANLLIYRFVGADYARPKGAFAPLTSDIRVLCSMFLQTLLNQSTGFNHYPLGTPRSSYRVMV